MRMKVWMPVTVTKEVSNPESGSVPINLYIDSNEWSFVLFKIQHFLLNIIHNNINNNNNKTLTIDN